MPNLPDYIRRTYAAEFRRKSISTVSGSNQRYNTNHTIRYIYVYTCALKLTSQINLARGSKNKEK